VYACLDVIGDWEATKKNQEYMESQGLNPLPTFHYGSPLEELERLVEKYDYIALGGLVPLSLQKNKLRWWLDKCFLIIKNRCRVHGFGVNALWAWERYPFYSVDGTSWQSSVRFGSNTFESNKDKNFFENKTLSSIERTENILVCYNKQKDYVTSLWEGRGVSFE